RREAVSEYQDVLGLAPQPNSRHQDHGLVLEPWHILGESDASRVAPAFACQYCERCVFRLPCRVNASGLLGASGHAASLLFPTRTLFPYRSNTSGQRISVLS